MKRTPFDLGFADLVGAGQRAARAALDQAEQAGVEVAAFSDPLESPPRGAVWTADRVDLLKQLWADGISASQIAKRLSGVSRKEVEAQVKAHDLVVARPVIDKSAPVREISEGGAPATVLTLGAHMCKWPIGDPSSDSFTFCGRRIDVGGYCLEHAKVAYQGRVYGLADVQVKVIPANAVIELRHRVGS